MLCYLFLKINFYEKVGANNVYACNPLYVRMICAYETIILLFLQHVISEKKIALFEVLK